MTTKLIYGIGYNSKGKHKTRISGNHPLVYRTWRSMIARCYSAKLHEKYPTYIGCSVVNEWHDYQGFGDWFENHEYSNHGYHLDKDLLIPGNKIYTPSTVCFVPQQLNNLLNGNGTTRGDLPQGVCLPKTSSKFMANISLNGKRQHLGYFDTLQEACQAYKTAKEAYVKQMALKWQDKIADNVFDALMNWELDPK